MYIKTRVECSTVYGKTNMWIKPSKFVLYLQIIYIKLILKYCRISPVNTTITDAAFAAAAAAAAVFHKKSSLSNELS